MAENRQFWPVWAHFLQRWNLQGTASALLESAGPLAVIMAQLMYFGQPFMPQGQGLALGQLLEDRQEARAFADFLREEETR